MSKSDSKMVKHARHELELAKAFDKTENYDGSIGRGVLAMVKVFDTWFGGDRAKAESALMGFNQVLSGELLSPPTTDPEEWDVVEGADPGTVRNKRCPFYVSTDNGKTWMHLQNKERGNSRDHITGKDVEDERGQDNNTADGKSSDGGANQSSENPIGHVAPAQTAKDPVPTNAQGSATDDQGSSESTPAPDGSGLNAGVESEGEKDQSQPQKPEKKPEAGAEK